MGKKSKRGSGPRPGSNRAERVAARKARAAAALAPSPRPFAGLAAECDLVALRAFVPSATAVLDLIEPGPPQPELTSVMPDDTTPIPPASDATRNNVVLATILPGAVAAITREVRGATEGLAALQTDPDPDDLNRALAAAIEWAAHTGPGNEYRHTGEEADGPELADILDVDAQLPIIVHNDFSWWFPPGNEVPPEIATMLERANETVLPTARMHVDSGNGAPWWVDAGERAHLRWVRPEPEDDVMTALARLHAAGRLTLGEGSRFAGSFRTHGLLVPVFDLDNERHHEEWYDALDQFDGWLTDALAETTELTIEERSSRDGIRGRQVTLR
ncbi:DUF5926 family protein [Gordonia polyisoprenivorans]|uniref:DUF5926 family protein n=1 Tax=Gordonia polyisoprenivorans TaxID=84595 RepID=UPI000B99ECEC|nr:DUF5926 family protein [Gordonia polyisoprenivorans]OZC33325.1 preprotein translocase subunit SecA [Gordonia polyisoprenivorans]